MPKIKKYAQYELRTEGPVNFLRLEVVVDNNANTNPDITIYLEDFQDTCLISPIHPKVERLEIIEETGQPIITTWDDHEC